MIKYLLWVGSCIFMASLNCKIFNILRIENDYSLGRELLQGIVPLNTGSFTFPIFTAFTQRFQKQAEGSHIYSVAFDL